MGKYRYAAYGSNLHPLRLRRRVPSATFLGKDFLDLWGLRFNKKSDKDGSGKCSISKGGDGVHVAVFEIDRSEKMILDRIEGLGYGYDETIICLPNHGDCLTYLAKDEVIDDSLRPIDWYKEIVALGCRYHGFPARYLRQIEAIQAQSDNDEVRSRAEWKLVEILRKGT